MAERMTREQKQFTNPVLAGFYPDPSICRVGEDYYLTTSSFVYFPGLPVFHSKDLVHWEQIGHAITRANAPDYKNCETSLGLWAPTIRYHEGTFYIINTFVSEGREARRDNFILTARDPAGPWSKPVFIEGADGIDPSLFFDTDGGMWYVGNFIVKDPRYEGHHGIYLCELDSHSFQFAGERIVVWDGALTHGRWLEAPHIYKKDDFYYLMAAEGGTFTDHSVVMARADKLTGAYEPCPRNPIVTHRHLPLSSPISVVGHGDLIETQNHEWWMVLLGVRNYEGHHFNTGRETFLLPMVWEENDWPMADTGNGLVNERERLPDLPEFSVIPQTHCDQFEEETPALAWNTIHPPAQSFYTLTERPGWLRLRLKPQSMEEICCPAFVGRRQQHRQFLARTSMEFCPRSEKEEAGVCLVQDDRYHYSFVKGRNRSGEALYVYRVEDGRKERVKEIALRPVERLYLSVVCRVNTYDFYYGYREKEYREAVAGLPASVLSSWVNKGFTGVYLGMYATSNGAPGGNTADFDWFLYESV